MPHLKTIKEMDCEQSMDMERSKSMERRPTQGQTSRKRRVLIVPLTKRTWICGSIALAVACFVSGAIGYLISKSTRSMGYCAQPIPSRSPYYGMSIGSFPSSAKYGLKGSLFAASSRVLFLKHFSFDGGAPDAVFWGGTTPTPHITGFLIPGPNNQTSPLRKYHCENLVLWMPNSKGIKGTNWVSVFGQLTKEDYGRIDIPRNLVLPKAKDIGPLGGELAHGVSTDTVVIKDHKTILIKNLHYDGKGPDAFFLVGLGEPGPHGTKVPDENGSFEKLKAYTGKDITLRLPDKITVFDIDWFAIYCIKYRHNFAYHKLDPEQLKGIPADSAHLSALSKQSRARRAVVDKDKQVSDKCDDEGW